MPYNLLIFPLSAGYFILLNFVLLKYKYQRLSSQRILFNAIITGIFLLFFVFIFRTIIEAIFPQLIPDIITQLNKTPIKKIDYLWTSVFSFLFAIIATIVINLFIIYCYGVSKPISWAVKKYGDEIEKLFRISAETGELMQLTLKNNKVYIGFTDIIPVPKETNFLKITPVMSGYRDSETKTLKITTEYFDVLDIYLSEEPEFDIYDIDISIKKDEILTAGIYDQNVFDLFNKKIVIEKKEDSETNL